MALTSTASDKELARQLRKGNHEAFDEIMFRYKEQLYSFICRYVVDRDEAYDLLQETFLNVFQKIHLYDYDKKFSTWLFQIALNKCRDWGRKQKLRRVISFMSHDDSNQNTDFIGDIDDHAVNPEQTYIIKSELETVAKAIGMLPHKLKTPLIMCSLNGMSYEECAVILSVSTKTVEMRIYRARKRLELLLAR